MAGTVTVEVRQVGPATSEGRARTHTVRIDRPLEKGGADQGPMGGELLLLALGGCFMSNLLAAIRAREAGVTNVRVEVTGTLAEAPPRFSAIELRVHADYTDRALMEKLVQISERACIVANTLRDAVTLSVRVV